MSDCVFCNLYENDIGVIYANRYFWAQFDSYPVSPGHAELIPINHRVSLFDLTEEEGDFLLPSLARVIEVIEATDLKLVYEAKLENPLNAESEWFCNKMLEHIGLNKKPDTYNYGINDGRAAGRTVDHLHIHIMPRFCGDVPDPIGGVRHMFPGMGNYKKLNLQDK